MFIIVLIYVKIANCWYFYRDYEINSFDLVWQASTEQHQNPGIHG